MYTSITDWLNITFGIDNTVSVPIVVTLMIFIIGGLANAFKNWVSGSIQKRKTRKTFKNIVKEIARTCKIKSKHIKDFYPTLTITHDSTWTLKTNSITYIGIAFNQEYSTVYHAYRKKNIFNFRTEYKTKCFNKIWAILENIKFMEDRMVIEFDKFYQKFNQHDIAYADNMEKMRQQNDDLMQRTATIPREEQRLIAYMTERDRIFYTWQQMDNRVEIFNSHDHLVTPLRELNRQYPELSIATEQNNFLLPAAYEYKQMLATLNNYQTMFKNYHYNYQNSYKVLEYCLKKI